MRQDRVFECPFKPCSGYVDADSCAPLPAKPQRYIIQSNDGLIHVMNPMLNGGTKVPLSNATQGISGPVDPNYVRRKRTPNNELQHTESIMPQPSLKDFECNRDFLLKV
jgi:hypothetical protein